MTAEKKIEVVKLWVIVSRLHIFAIAYSAPVGAEAARWAMGELPDSLATPSSAAFSRATIDGAIMNDARASSRSALGETVSWTGYRVAYIAE